MMKRSGCHGGSVGHGFDTHMIAGNRACSTCIRAAHPTITNQTSRHYAETLLQDHGPQTDGGMSPATKAPSCQTRNQAL
jgi:hypothetical protein